MQECPLTSFSSGEEENETGVMEKVFQEGTDTAGPSEDSNIATRGGKDRKSGAEQQSYSDKDKFELNPRLNDV